MTNAASLANPLLSAFPDLHMATVTITADRVVADLIATCPHARCPSCAQLAHQIHSRYHRTVADLPWAGWSVRLHLIVRKFFCTASDCPRRIFTERLPSLVAPYARRTLRLEAILRAIGFALGGAAGARLVARLGMKASPATLLRLLRATPLPVRPTPRVLGVDDWAYRKGHTYGTILLDLERHRVVDLLPDREAATLAHWLQDHPGVEIATRDRSGTSATGLRQGAPTALQIADRFHLCQNLGDAMERFFNRQRRLLHQVPAPVSLKSQALSTAETPPMRPAAVRRSLEAAKAQTRSKREARYRLIQQRVAQGASIAALARELHLHWKTVRKYAQADVCPTAPTAMRRPRLLTSYEPFLRQRWAEGCHHGVRLHQEIVAQGFTGSRILVARFLAELRGVSESIEESDESLTVDHTPHLSPRRGALLIGQRPDRRTTQEQVALGQLRELSPEIARVVELGEHFCHMLREREGADACRLWVQEAGESGNVELRRFAIKLKQDLPAVEAACSEHWSNGQTEGQVNKLKLLKRGMYGRAKFDLLRQRVLQAA
jgi:transposase